MNMYVKLAVVLVVVAVAAVAMAVLIRYVQRSRTSMSPQAVARRRRTLLQAGEAVKSFLAARSVAIICLRENVPVEIGSGTCIKIGDRSFVATAAHILKEYGKNNLFLAHAESDGQTEASVPLPILNANYTGGETTDPVDVAYLELSREVASQLVKTFVSIDLLRPNISELNNDLVVVHGYPAKLLDPDLIALKRLRAKPLVYMTYACAVRDWPADKSDRHDLILDYPKKGSALAVDGGNTQEAEVPPAPGLSGGGFWAADINSPGIWSPHKLRLIGIDRSWHEDSRWVRGTQIQHWLALVRRDYPHLRTNIDHVT